jgi:hypothetical protein
VKGCHHFLDKIDLGVGAGFGLGQDGVSVMEEHGMMHLLAVLQLTYTFLEYVIS